MGTYESVINILANRDHERVKEDKRMTGSRFGIRSPLYIRMTYNFPSDPVLNPKPFV